MTLLDIINTLKGIALNQPEVRGASDGDVYEALNGNPSLKYSVFHVTQTSHSTADGWDNYGLSLFVIDRLTDDGSNRLEIQSRAKETLSNIIYTFCQNFDAEHNSISFTPFTQKFKDNTAGVWANVSINVLADTVCPLDYVGGSYYPSVTVIDNLDIYINEVGVYEVPDGYTGYGRITVDFPLQSSVDVELNQNNKEYTIEPDSQYAGVKEVNVKVNIPLQAKDITVNDNTLYTVESDLGYEGLSTVNINVEVPLQTKEITLKENTQYTIQPDPEYKGIEDLTVNVEVPVPSIEEDVYLEAYTGDEGILKPSDGYDAIKQVSYKIMKSDSDKMRVPNGLTLSGSTFTELDGSHLDWSGIYDGYEFFKDCPNVTKIKGVNFGKLTNMASMFLNCPNLTEIEGMDKWNTKYITSLGAVFKECPNLTDFSGVTNWNTSNVTTLYNAFNQSGLSDLTPIKDWDVSNVTTLYNAFNKSGISDLTPIKNWNVSKVTTMESAFQETQIEEADLSSWDTTSLTNIKLLFKNCKNLRKVNLTNWWKDDLQIVDWIYGCSNIEEIIIEDWRTTIGFSDKTNLKRFNAPNLVYTTLNGRFKNCTSLESLETIGTWDISAVTDASDMLNNCKNLSDIKPLGGWDTSNFTGMTSTFYNCESLESLDGLENWNTSGVTSMDSTFYANSALTDISALRNWDTSNVTTLFKAFAYSYSLSDLSPIANWDTTNLTSLNQMFANFDATKRDDALTEFSGMNWNTSNVTTVNGMFWNKWYLEKVDISNWDLSNVTAFNSMFNGCSSLKEVRMGGHINQDATVSYMFLGIGNDGTFYYPAEYASEYSKIRSQLPSGWKKVEY